mgnify:CR=1 FL=1
MHVKKDLSSIVFNRWLLNVLFWVGYMLIPFVLTLSIHTHEKSNTRSHIVLGLFYALLIYINNLVLMPKFFETRKFRTYFISLVPLLLLWAAFQATLDPFFYGCKCPYKFTVSGFFTACFQLISFIAMFIVGKNIQDAIIREERNKLKEQERIKSELNFLKEQINPHFLFNTLNNLYSFAIAKSDEVPKLILKLSGLLRYMLYECNATYVPLDRELDYIESYIDLQRLRLEGRGTVSFSVEGMPGVHKIAPLLLINFVENCFKHTMDNPEGGIDIQIGMNIDEERLYFSTENNSSHKKDEQTNSGGIGMQNVQKRLDLLYADKYELSYRDEGGKYYVNLVLKLL